MSDMRAAVFLGVTIASTVLFGAGCMSRSVQAPTPSETPTGTAMTFQQYFAKLSKPQQACLVRTFGQTRLEVWATGIDPTDVEIPKIVACQNEE